MNQDPAQVTYYPSRTTSKNAAIKNLCEYKDLRLEAEEDLEGFWDRLAKEHIDWIKPYNKVLDESNAPFYKWFVNGKLNVSCQCLDRHLKTRKNKAAIIFEGKQGDRRVLTHLELSYEVNRAANLLRNRFKIQKGGSCNHLSTDDPRSGHLYASLRAHWCNPRCGIWWI